MGSCRPARRGSGRERRGFLSRVGRYVECSLEDKERCEHLLANNEEPVQKQVLDAARRLTNNGKEPFTIAQIVAALPELNKGTVRTHVSSRCCVNAPCNHLHRWPYFYRLSRGLYRLRRPFISPDCNPLARRALQSHADPKLKTSPPPERPVRP